MKTIKIIDCFNNEHNVNVEMIYSITEFQNKTETIITINLNHKDDNYTFSTIKTYELKKEILKRLEGYK
ncbi:hypothetical protein [Flavobacterium sp. WC2430]|uniref:hypothetical protein n=1 Tax=Flavobacterium sp. WC2430 TaxID=3234137 RepID=UPI0034655AEA